MLPITSFILIRGRFNTGSKQNSSRDIFSTIFLERDLFMHFTQRAKFFHFPQIWKNPIFLISLQMRASLSQAGTEMKLSSPPTDCTIPLEDTVIQSSSFFSLNRTTWNWQKSPTRLQQQNRSDNSRCEVNIFTKWDGVTGRVLFLFRIMLISSGVSADSGFGSN